MKTLLPTLSIAFSALFSNYSVHAQVISTIAGGGTAVPGDNAPATNAGLSYVADIVTDTAGNIYIADANNDRIRKIDKAGIITTVAGGGTKVFIDGVPATDAKLANPLGVAIDLKGNIYIADNGHNRIQKVDASGNIYVFAGNGSMGYTGDGGPAKYAGLFNSQGVTVDTAGNVYIADNGNSVVRKVDKAGIITTFAGSITSGFSGDGGPATDAELTAPNYISADNKGNFYITDGEVIRKVNSTGIITTIAGDPHGIAGYTGDGGPATAATFDYPRGNRVDSKGELYIADWWNNVIRKVDTKGVITTIAGDGFGAGLSTGNFSGDGGLATLAELYYPTAIAFGKSGSIYIADGENTRVRKITSLTDPSLNTVNVNSTLAISLFPNPNKGDFIIRGTVPAANSSPVSFEITNLLGQTIYKGAATVNKGQVLSKVSLGDIPCGTYFLHFNGRAMRFVVAQ